LLSLVFLASSSVEIVAAMISAIKIEKTGNSGACCESDVGDEFPEGVESVEVGEAVGDGLLEGATVGLDVGLDALGPKIMFALVVVQGIC